MTDSSDQTADTAPEPSAPLRASEDTVYYGASGVNVVPTVWATQIMFMTPTLSQDGVYNSVDVVASLPWPLTKALHEILGMIIAQYEKDEGAPIRLPNSFSQLLAELKSKQANG